MRRFILAVALAVIATSAACASPTEVICLRPVVVVDSITGEPVTDAPLHIEVPCEEVIED